MSLIGKSRLHARGQGIIGQSVSVPQPEPLDLHLDPDGSRRPRQDCKRSLSVGSDDIDVAPVAGPSTRAEQPRPVSPRPVPPSLIKTKTKTNAIVTTKPKKRAKTRESQFVATVSWPDHFKQLEKVFKSLNTVYTFCQTRKHLATTFENIKSSVQGLIKRPLEIQDLAQIKSLLPKLVTFAYTLQESLQVHASGAQSQPDHYAPTSVTDERDHVLLFQFNDGELKASNQGGKAVNKRARKTQDTERVPTFSHATMIKMIEKRNQAFSAAVNELLVASEAQNKDPVALLFAATNNVMPVRPGEGQDTRPISDKRDDLAFYLEHPEHRPSIETILGELQDQSWYVDQIVPNGHVIVDAKEPVYGHLDEPLSDTIMDALYQTKQITKLYCHQAEAINHLSHNRNVIVSTSTSSGKSLIYQIPAFKHFESDPCSTVMYIFPTKALAQDQKRSLMELLSACPGMEEIKIATFDGDTVMEDRNFIRDHANVIFTNPDMLHVTILPREEEWRRFFQNLRLVVVDELHMYNGLFGCQVAFVMRRLRRICAAVGNKHVQFVSCSATVANPAKHMETVFGIEDVQVVSQDGSPSGGKEHVVWNPPFVDPQHVTQGRVHSITEASRVFRFLMERGVRAIVFCKVRKFCELLMRQVRQDLAAEGRQDMVGRVMPYRSGYSAQDRRRIEQEMFQGKLLGIVATTALELGIDIGSLDAVISVGFPYTLSGLRQQAGRAGRRNKDSLAMFICDPWPLDQHYAKHPEHLYTTPDAAVSLDLENELVLEGHLQCAADEMPIHPIEDVSYFGPNLAHYCATKLVADDQGFYHCHPSYKPYPARHVPLRATDDEHYTIVDVTDGRYKALEETEWSRALFEIYEGAVFHHQGRTFLVKDVNHDSRIARIEEANVDWSTRQRDFTDVDAVEAFRIRAIRNSTCFAYYGRVKVTSVVFGYFKVDRRANILDTVDVDAKPYIRDTHGLWLDVPAQAMDILRSKNIHAAASIHAAEHALLSLTPMFVMSVQGDVKTECKAPEKELSNKRTRRVRPARLTLYDAAGKSSGICVKAFDRINDLLNQALDTILNCPCEEGCPSCVSSTVCNEGNIVLAKLGAIVVLSCLAGRELDVASIPVQPLPPHVPTESTIELTPPVRSAHNVMVINSDGTAV